jgi:RHS repeat-associated protein
LLYDASNALVEEINYTYDGTGKRTSKRDRFGMENYNYKAGFQLDTISGASSENYDFDVNGRLTLIERDGQTIDLEHDAGDRLTTVENETTGKITQYVYDRNGDRIKAMDGTNVRQFLMAPAMGSGLQSTDLVSDENGNLLSNYVYAGGTTPFMMLDANGNPVYYLTDAMGTVIGLSDTTGQEVADFRYDAFGNSRGATGSAANAGNAKGDFRFQGQWLESESGIYYFRARDYDAQTGAFISRDPVDVIESEPESMNPYQFVSNNPHVYSDPTGMFSISELNASFEIQKVLDGIQAEISNRAKQFLIDKAKGIVGEAVKSVISSILPADSLFLSVDILTRAGGGQNRSNAGIRFEDIVQDKVCDTILGSYQQYTKSLWLEPRIDANGRPQSDGFNCGDTRRPDASFYLSNQIFTPRPDFVIKNGGPRNTDHARSSRFPKAYLIGDIKLTGNALYRKIGSSQWDAIMGYAKYGNNHQYTPVALFITFTTPKDFQRKRVERKAWEQGVSTAIVSILPTRL